MAETCLLLDEDPELGQALEGERLEVVRRGLWAAVVESPVEEWDPDRYADLARGGIGLLIIEGLIVRRMGRQARRSAELLGPGDILRPWQHDGEEATMPLETSWKVLDPLRLAVLDLSFTARVGHVPEVVGELVGRATSRSRILATHLAILHHPRVERRLLLLLWHLAERWGRVTPDGVALRLPLTHELLAELVAARRPSVTTSLGQLVERGELERCGSGWLLRGEPPDDDLPQPEEGPATDPVPSTG